MAGSRWLAAGILGLGLAGGFALAQGRPSPVPRQTETLAPLVRVVRIARTADRQSWHLLGFRSAFGISGHQHRYRPLYAHFTRSSSLGGRMGR